MRAFFDWFETDATIDPVIKAGVAHLWFVTIHPFEDGNGRIACAIADLALTRSEGNPQRFYSMSAQIRVERIAYHEMLKKSQKGELDITDWLEWFLECLDRAFDASETILASVLRKARFWSSRSGEPLNDRQRTIINRLLDGFEGKLTSSKWAKLAKCSQDTALRDIDDLLKRDILLKDAAGGRSTSYPCAKLWTERLITLIRHRTASPAAPQADPSPWTADAKCFELQSAEEWPLGRRSCKKASPSERGFS